MNFGEYSTPGDVRLYIGPSWIDDAYRVDFEEQNKKVPIWGYHQKFYADVCDGKAITVGNLIIHYRFPGYLTYAIKRVLDERERSSITDSITRSDRSIADALPAMAGVGIGAGTVAKASPTRFAATKDNFTKTVQDVRKMTVGERVKTLLNSYQNGAFDQMSGLMRGIYGQVFEDKARDYPLESPVEMGPGAYVQGRLGFDLTLYYGYVGDRGRGIYVAEVLKGVHLTGRRKVINASTSGGDLSASGQTLLEVYPFFCRNVEPQIFQADQGPPVFGA